MASVERILAGEAGVRGRRGKRGRDGRARAVGRPGQSERGREVRTEW